jgi:hypothetical protein
MHSTEMSDRVASFFEEANSIQRKKNADYHPDKVAFLEIMRTASECRMTVEQDLWAKIRKQYIALRSFTIDGKVESEPPRSRMIDVAVYMGMLAVWTDHKKQIIRDGLEFVLNETSCDGPAPQCHRLMTMVEVCDRCQFKFWLQDNVD